MARHYSAPPNSSSQGLIWVLGLALLICIAVISWQAGRLSAVEEYGSAPDSNQMLPGADMDSGDTVESTSKQNNRRKNRYSRERDEANEREGSIVKTSEASAVRQYFSQMDMAAASAANLMDPNDLAQSVLGQALSGDLSGFDGITSGQRDVVRRMKEIVPPAGCEEHHRLSIQTMEKAVDVMEGMSRSLEDQDMTQMLMLSMRAQSLMDDAEKVDVLGKELEEQYGL